MMYAIIDSCGRQYKVSEGDVVLFEKLEVEEGKKVMKPSTPTRNGYTFVGWTLNGSNYNFNSAVKGNITLVAKWEKNKTEDK